MKKYRICQMMPFVEAEDEEAALMDIMENPSFYFELEEMQDDFFEQKERESDEGIESGP